MAQPLPRPRPNRKPLRDYLTAVQPTERDLRAVLRNASDEAERMIPKLIEQNTQGSKVRAAQLRLVLREIKLMQSSMWGDVGLLVREGVRRVYTTAYTEAEDVLFQYLQHHNQSPTLFRAALAAEARRGVEAVLAKAQNNIPLSTQVYRTQALTQGTVDRIVQTGMLLQKSAKQIAKDVAHLINPNVPGGISYAAMRLARTELNNAFKTAQEHRYKDEPWTKGMRWNLSGSHPERDECNDYAEADDHDLGVGVYPVGKRPHSHPNCLCYLTPVQIEEDEFIEEFLSGDYDNYLDDKVGAAETDQMRDLGPALSPQQSAVYEMRRDGRTTYQITKFLISTYSMSRVAARRFARSPRGKFKR